MKKMVKKLKKFLRKNKEDLQYLLYVGVPSAILIIIIDYFFALEESSS